MKQDRLTLTAGFMPAIIMGLLLFAEQKLADGTLPKAFWMIAVLEVAAYLIPLVLLRTMRNGEGKRARFRVKRAKRQSAWFVFWMSLTAALLAMLINSGFSLLLDQGYYHEGVSLASYGYQNLWQSLLIVVVLPAVVEELFFRGVLFSALEASGTWPALILTSAAFAMIHGSIANLAGPFAAGMIFGYMTYVLDSVWPAVFAHLLHNTLFLLLSYAAKTYSALGLWPYITLIALFCFFLCLAISMRALEGLIEKGKIRGLQYAGWIETATALFISPGMWLLLIMFIVRVLY